VVTHTGRTYYPTPSCWSLPRLDPRLREQKSQRVVLVVAHAFRDEVDQASFRSNTTVKTHVTPGLAKLDLRDRVQAVAIAYETWLSRPSEDATSAATAGRSAPHRATPERACCLFGSVMLRRRGCRRCVG
jgi:hypothetical protein